MLESHCTSGSSPSWIPLHSCSSSWQEPHRRGRRRFGLSSFRSARGRKPRRWSAFQSSSFIVVLLSLANCQRNLLSPRAERGPFGACSLCASPRPRTSRSASAPGCLSRISEIVWLTGGGVKPIGNDEGGGFAARYRRGRLWSDRTPRDRPTRRPNHLLRAKGVKKAPRVPTRASGVASPPHARRS